jgi:outer membrane protein assembly factor BamE (lipoprotein component of BamABCDE complex)
MRRDNALSLVITVFVFLVVACSCPSMSEIQKKIEEEQQRQSRSNSSNSSNTGAAKSSASKSALSLEQYNRLKTGMTYEEVADIMGSPGTETSSSQFGRFKTSSYKWEGEDFQMVLCVFSNDKLTSKTQANLK